MPKSKTTKRKTQGSSSAASYSALKKRFDAQAGELREALEQQAAMSEILRVIASSPTDLQPVLDTVAENAARLCEANDATINRIDGNTLQRLGSAKYGPMPASPPPTLSRGNPSGRAVIDRTTVHVHDITAEFDGEFPESRLLQQRTGARTILCTPLLREGTPIGVITIRRTAVRPFTDKQITLLKIFADQAVIAIENVRLFQELKQRTAQLETSNGQLTEALEHQTATSEVLVIISRSPTDVQPVLDAIVESAARICGIDRLVLRLREGNAMVPRAHFGRAPITSPEIGADEPPHFRWMRERGALHIPDVRAQNEFSEVGSVGSYRTFLGVPLRQQGELVGALIARRTEVRPFSPVQVKLLETFADQAVIAIENVRLLQELKESLEQQTATSQILGVIASSPTDIQPVLDVVAENAARVCGATDARIFRIEGDTLQLAASYGTAPRGLERGLPLSRGTVSGRAVVDRETIHVHDVAAELETEFPESKPAQQLVGFRTVLATPLLREGVPIGVIFIRRLEVRPFTDKQITLLKTFADQAVIAIENVRLFKEIQDRNAELREALEHQTATSEVLRVIASSPTELQPVLDTVIANAVTLAGANHGHIRQLDGEALRLAAHYNESPEVVALLLASVDIQQSLAGRAFREGRPIQSVATQEEPGFSRSWSKVGARSLLAVPLLRKGTPIGNILIWRDFVEPFTERQIDLVKTFADQAVIAIENVRLFRELENRNRDLTEALEQQTATSEILRVIASSPTDLQPVLDAVVQSAARLCEAGDAQLLRIDGDVLRLAAAYGGLPAAAVRSKTRGRATGRAVIERRAVHVHDLVAEREEFPDARQDLGVRTALAMPLLREGVPVGVVQIRRTEVRPFTEKQIALLKTFADQAVIAIENVRLFKELQERNAELREALEHQTATAEVLGIISRSPTDVQPVLDAIVESAARVCGIDDVVLRLHEGDTMDCHGRILVQYRFAHVEVEY